jgi:hypothetical protein
VASVALSGIYLNKLRFYSLWENSDKTMRQIVAAANCRTSMVVRHCAKNYREIARQINRFEHTTSMVKSGLLKNCQYHEFHRYYRFVSPGWPLSQQS